MTLCIAALCDDNRTIVLAADNYLGMGFVSAELPIKKVLQIHQHWWALLAGNASYAMDIIDAAKMQLASKETVGYDEVHALLGGEYQRKRLDIAETLYLKSRGWNKEDFRTKGMDGLGASLYLSIDSAIQNFDLGVDLIMAGFGSDGMGHVSSIRNPGVITRHDLPGFHAIGVGMFGAIYFMAYRELATTMSVEECLYYVSEAHFFGYQAGGVGDVTDIVVLRHQDKPLFLDKPATNALQRIWEEVLPRWPKRLDRIKRHLERLRLQLNEGKITMQSNLTQAPHIDTVQGP